MGNRLSKSIRALATTALRALATVRAFRRTANASKRTGQLMSSTARSVCCWRFPDCPPRWPQALTEVQHELFDMGGELSIPGHHVITAEHILRLEVALDGFNDSLPPLKEFILPGGGPAAAACHLARTIARRAERRVVDAFTVESVSP